MEIVLNTGDVAAYLIDIVAAVFTMVPKVYLPDIDEEASSWCSSNSTG
jgi:hypothetical protein